MIHSSNFLILELGNTLSGFFRGNEESDGMSVNEEVRMESLLNYVTFDNLFFYIPIYLFAFIHLIFYLLQSNFFF